MPVDYNPFLPEVIADPFPVFRELREHDPVHWSDHLGAWVLTRYDDVVFALKDARLSANRIGGFMERLPPERKAEVAALGESLKHWIVFSDPPVHTRLRTLLNKAFTPRVVEGMRPWIEETVEDLLDAVAPRGHMDVIRELAYPLPAAAIARMIGVPRADVERFKHWSDELAAFVGSALNTPNKRERGERAIREMNAYLGALATERRAAPRDDIMSALVAVEERGDTLSHEEVLGSCILLLFAGHETTTNLIGNGLLALLRHPDQLRRLRDEPALLRPAIEELLRYDGPVSAMARVALEDVSLGGKTIHRGDRVFNMLNAANRDPRQFADPEGLDIARGENHHVTFGFGMHYCLGAPLARAEAQITFAALLRRLPEINLQSANLEWSDSLSLRGLRSLEVSFEVAAATRPAAASTPAG